MAVTLQRFFLSFVSLSFLAGFLSANDLKSPLSPEESRRQIELADPNLQIELVVSEPAINSPVALCWDASGAMYVVEMSDYPTAETGGKIKRLEDRDHDGLYEHVTTFAEGLHFPSGALPWNDGLLVTVAPDILYLQDKDGDGRADERRVLYTGFTPGNQQLRVNGLTWGLDNWIYGANGRSGGEVKNPAQPNTPPVLLRRHDFRFDPRSGKFEALAGFSQFGLGRDDFQHRFLSWNTVPFRQAVIEEQDLNRNPLLTSGESIALIADPGDTGHVYPISQPPKTFNRERTDYFNASAGTTVFRGDALGPDYQGNAFVGEPLTNLVSRRLLQPNGSIFAARRIEDHKEFLASRDSWTHPVFITGGPDGCLYIADFYREWVEHPQFVQEALRKDVNFRVGSDHGRIWRIRNKNKSRPTPHSPLSKRSTEELVNTLNSPNGWTRDTAQRLLVERQDKSAAPLLTQLLSQGQTPATRAQALWTLSALEQIPPAAIQVAAADQSPAVREQALSLARRFEMKSLFPELRHLAKDVNPMVRLQVALAAGGDANTPGDFGTLLKISKSDANDPWIRLAILSGLGNSPGKFLEGCCFGENLQPHTSVETLQFLNEVAELVGASTSPADRKAFHATLKNLGPEQDSLALTLLAGFSAGLTRRNQTLDQALAEPSLESFRPQVTRLINLARQTAENHQADEPSRLTGLRLVMNGPRTEAATLLEKLLVPTESPALQNTAAHALGELNDPELARKVLDRWGTFPINTRREIANALIRQSTLAGILLDAVEQSAITPAEIEFTQREALSRLKDPALQMRVAKLLKSSDAADREAVIAKYQSSLSLPGDAHKGALIFAQNCIVCHQMRGQGARVGPELSGIASRPKPAILVDILNPSKEVSPDFYNYVVVTRQGQVFTGLLAADTPHSLRLRRQQGAEDTILRSNLEELRLNGKSLMPEGFEQKLTPADIANLLEFLQHPVTIPAP